MKVVDWGVKDSTETSGWARVLADSMSPAGVRLTTLEVVMWRGVLAEFNTHRMFSRNSASSRAIPVEKMLARVRDTPFIPRRFPVNKPGMSATDYLDRTTADSQRDPFSDRYDLAENWWLSARDDALSSVEDLMDQGIHKQIANRLLEPWMWHTVIVTATDWDNFFDLRISEFAQPEIYDVAVAMKVAMDDSIPQDLIADQWHLPLVSRSEAIDLGVENAIKVSVARCAAVSYNRHDTESTLEKELARYDGLKANRHMSPFEHAATSQLKDSKQSPQYYANFRGWQQARWFVEHGLELPL